MVVLETLIFDFLNHRTGRLDPSYAAIAAKAGVRVRTVANALERLRELELGILNSVRRCPSAGPTGGSCWSGRRLRRATGEPVAGLPGAPGAAASLPGASPGAFHRPCCQRSPSGGRARDPKDGLAAALARLGRAFMARDT
jgi:hypothetical protein